MYLEVSSNGERFLRIGDRETYRIEHPRSQDRQVQAFERSATTPGRILPQRIHVKVDSNSDTEAIALLESMRPDNPYSQFRIVSKTEEVIIPPHIFQISLWDNPKYIMELCSVSKKLQSLQ